MAPCTENMGRTIDQEWDSVPIDLASFDATTWTQSRMDMDMSPLETLGLLWMIHHLIFDRSIDGATMERIDDTVGEVRWTTLPWDPDATIITLGSKVQTATTRAHNTTPTGTIWFTPKRQQGIHGEIMFAPSKSSTAVVLELNWLLVAQDMQPCATLWYKPPVLDSIMAQQLACTLSRLTYCALNQPGAAIGKWDWVTTESKAVLQRWNPPYLPTALPTLADILKLQVQKRPNSSAICAWDGDWTYSQLEMHATMLAGYLMRLGVQRGEMVALRAEKSKWSVAAMVAILKVGAACIPIDVRNPIKRVGQILKQTKAQLLVTTHDTARINLPASVHEFIVPQADQMENQKTESLPQVDLSAVAFVFYTSGSTGVPKGVIQGHRAISGALKENLVSMGLNCDSRTFQYASYAFDPCIMDIFGTFSVGGCVCIPSESQRLEELASTICHMRASHLCVTPTILATLSPNQVSTLVCVSMGGESVSVELVQLWSSHVRLVALYGTTESVQWDTSYEFQTPHDNHKLIGRGIKSNIWIVDPDNPERLMPLGAIGELLVSGPLVADGYLDDDVKTTASFIQAPPWLRWFRANRADRLYRTGDLARYRSDGNIEIIGRRDRQVKINGQRIELSEIESALRLKLPSGVDCVAEVISSKFRQGTKTLAMFLYSANGLVSDNRLGLLRVELTQELPAYMIPSAWITLESPVPRTLSGKVDRSTLRRLGAKWFPSGPQCDPEPPATDNEKIMQLLWSSILLIEPLSLIYRNSDFFRLGGTSVSAIQLVGMARTHGLRLSIADIFRHGHRLRDLAATAISIKSEAHMPAFAPFSMLNTVLPPSDIRTSISKACQVSPSAIHDGFPCSPLQEGFVALTQKNPGTYIVQIIVDLPEAIDLEKFQRAYTHVVATNSILRTRFVTIPDLGSSVQQVVIDETPWWWFYSDIDECCRKEREQLQCRLGDPMLRCSIFDNGLKKRSFVWTLHHALFDGWSLGLMFNSIQEEYLGQNLNNLVPYQHFVAHLSQNIDYDACHNFWKSELDGACFLPFPPSCPATYQPSASQGNIRHSVDSLQWPSNGITPSTVIRAAWALLLSRHTGCRDVVFGVTVSGRQADILGIEQMAGPTIATIPVRMRMDAMWSHSASEYLSQVQLQALNTIPYEQMGLSAIRRISTDAEQACQFQTLLVVQPPTFKSLSSSSGPTTFMIPVAENITSMSHTYAVMLQSWLHDTGVTLDLQFDEAIYSGHESQRILWQLESIIRQLCSSIEADEVPILAEIDYASPHDPVEIQQLNDICITMPHESVLVQISRKASRQPEQKAVIGWDGSLTYRQLDQYSEALAYHLVEQYKIESGNRIILSSEPSKWVVPAMLAILKAGAIIVMIDYSLPNNQVQAILEISEAVMALTSPSLHPQFQNLLQTLPLGERIFRGDGNNARSIRTSLLEDLACLIVSLGITGFPKTIQLTHLALACTAREFGTMFGLTDHSRVLQFSSHAFDISTYETLSTLVHGGCLCIPSEEERVSSLAQSIQSHEANFAIITPSTAKLLDPHNLPMLKTVVFCGEQFPKDLAADWASCMTAHNWCGRSKCSYQFPTGVTGKLNRKRLQGLASDAIASSRLTDRDDGSKEPPITAHEHALHQLWGQVFKLAPSVIGRESQFFQLGGDSIVAMQLVALARTQDWSLSVRDVLTCPRLSDMAARLESLHSRQVEGEHQSSAPFGLPTPPMDMDGIPSGHGKPSSTMCPYFYTPIVDSVSQGLCQVVIHNKLQRDEDQKGMD